jgi:hypothetical protein
LPSSRWQASAYVVESEVVRGPVLCLSRGSNLFALVLLFVRSDRSKEVENLVLSSRARCPAALVRPSADDAGGAAFLATLSRALPRRAWATTSVRPEALLRWHRKLCRGIGRIHIRSRDGRRSRGAQRELILREEPPKPMHAQKG